MPDPAPDPVTEFYSGIETGAELIPRLKLFVALYKAHGERLQRPMRVLDVGCGREALLERQLLAADAYYGCDIVAPHRPVDNFSVVDLNRGELAAAFAGQRFDVIFCGEVIEHVFSPDRLLEDLQALMDHDTLLILSTPNLAYWVNRVLLLGGISPLFLENSSRSKLGRRFKALGQGHTTEGHIRVFTHRAMLDLIGMHPLELTNVQSVPVWNLPLDNLVCRLSRHLAPVNVYSLRLAASRTRLGAFIPRRTPRCSQTASRADTRSPGYWGRSRRRARGRSRTGFP